MLFCKMNIVKQDKNGNWYIPKNQHRISRFFIDDIFHRIIWDIDWFFIDLAHLFEKHR